MFMQCGRDLSDAQEYIGKLELQQEEKDDEKRIYQIQLAAIKAENLGETVKGSNHLKAGFDGISHKTGIMSIATKVSEGGYNNDDLSMRSSQAQEKIAIDFLRQQNESQLNKIKNLENQVANKDNKPDTDLFKQINL